ncbi:MAG: SDR family oxidoreductase [Alphaproteobacteria bacterium]
MDKKIALITGAGSGIGKITAAALAKSGFTCVLTGRRRDTLEVVAQEITDAGGEALAIVSDVADKGAISELFAAIADRYGRLDLLFNNAGIFIPEVPFEDLSHDDWQRSIDINLTGVFLCMQEAFRIMKNQSPRGGRIINNGSISAHVPRPSAVSYTAAKHGVTGLTRQGALDGRVFDIACGQIDIGNAATEMTAKMTAGVTQADGSKAVEARMDAQNVADAVVYMASLPLDTNVLTLTVMANGMPYVGRG